MSYHLYRDRDGEVAVVDSRYRSFGSICTNKKQWFVRAETTKYLMNIVPAEFFADDNEKEKEQMSFIFTSLWMGTIDGRQDPDELSMLADAMEFPWGGHYEIDEETFDLFMSLRELALL